MILNSINEDAFAHTCHDRLWHAHAVRNGIGRAIAANTITTIAVAVAAAVSLQHARGTSTAALRTIPANASALAVQKCTSCMTQQGWAKL